MKKRLALLSALLIAACGDDVTQINQTGLEVADSAEDLSECTKDREGEQAFVKDENSARICIDGDWVPMVGDYSCKTVELKDGSGLKIVCNGDSIGVVLNGKDGEKGENGKDVTKPDTTDSGDVEPDTTVSDSEQVPVSLDSLAGYTQKGPFLKGSTVYLYELSDGRTLKQTNGNFTSSISQDNGRYKFSARDLVSQYAMIVVDGYYRNEVTGNTSDAPIRLKAITDMRKRSSANVNLLTHLEFERVYYLVTKDKMTVKNAKRQAQKEILREFHIELEDNTDAEDMDVFGLSDADAALLAVSILLQGDRSAAELASLLTEISNDMAEDGKWNGKKEKVDSLKAEMADWAMKVDFSDSANGLARFSNNVSNWHLGNTVPHFEKFIRGFYSVESGLGVCGDKEAPLDTVKNVSNSLVKSFYASVFSDTEISKTRFICKEIAFEKDWQIASDIEKDTAAWGADSLGKVKNGQINTDLVYVFDEGHWRHGTILDSVLVKTGGKACLQEGDTSSVRYDSLYYVCAAQSTPDTLRKWVVAPDIYNATLDLRDSCAAGLYAEAELVAGIADSNNKFICDDGVFREASNWESNGGRGCTVYNRGEYYVLDKDGEGRRQYSFYKCTDNGWEFTLDTLNRSVLPDVRQSFPIYRDGRLYSRYYREYKIVGIKTQMWMAENLNYTTDNSFCIGNDSTNCEKYGRFYTWARAVGKSESECGNGYRCNLNGRVQGVCPEGWHLPDKSEFEVLLDAVGGEETAALHLKTTSGWNDGFEGDASGFDTYGFSAIPTGRYVIDGGGGFDLFSYSVDFWSSTETYAMGMSYDYEDAMVYGTLKSFAYPVRCVMDD